MTHALSAGLMLAFALIFTSCTASLVQTLAVARTPQSEFVPPPDLGAERRQVAAPAPGSTDTGECRPAASTKQHTVPVSTPMRAQSTPKT